MRFGTWTAGLGMAISLGIGDADAAVADKIAYVTGGRTIRAVSADGKRDVAVARSGAVLYDFDMSRDGRRVAYVDDSDRVLVVTPPAKRARSVFDPDDGIEIPDWVEWSPGSDRIAYSHAVRTDPATNPSSFSRQALFVVNGDGSGRREIPLAGASWASPTWAPDGRRIAVTLGDPLTRAIWTVDVASGEMTRLFGVARPDAGDLAWSPDGSRFAFTSLARLRVVRADGSGERQVGPGPAFSPCWSPDGRWLAFVVQRGGKSAIAKVRADGTGFRRLTKYGSVRSPDWARGSLPARR